MSGIYDIGEVIFGILSAKEIKSMAVCKIDSSKLSGTGSVYDEHMGYSSDTQEKCITCGLKKECPGHFGYIDMIEPVLHPMYYKHITCFLKCFCKQCYRLLITEDQLNLHSLDKIKGERRFTRILERVEKVKMCCHCNYPQPKIMYKPKDNTIVMEYLKKKEEDKKKKPDKISITMSVEDIKKIFDNISDEDVVLLGLDPSRIHPKNLVITVFPVLPPCFVRNTLVYTQSGYKPIQNVRDTDLLYTHTGSFKRIKEIQETMYLSGHTITLKHPYQPHHIECTPEHPFYTKRNPQSNENWCEAKYLTTDHYLGMRINTNEILPNFTKTRYIEEWLLLGYFIQYGWVTEHDVHFAVKNPVPILEVLNHLKISHTTELIYQNTFITCKNVELIHSIDLLGQYFIPSWILDSPKWCISAFLQTYSLDNNYTYETAFSLQNLYLKLGIIMKITKEENNYRLRKVENPVDVILEDEYVWFKVESISVKKIDKILYVYNFEVEDDHTYVVENTVVHNCARPYLVTDGNICDDDLTYQTLEIVKINNQLKKTDLTEQKRQKLIQTLKFRIATFFNNSKGKAKHPTDSRPIKGIKERLASKDGQIRNNHMGKRVDFSGRTVIGADPTLKLGEVGVPEEMTRIHTKPEPVTKYNIEEMTELVNSGKANFILKNNGQTRINLQYAMYRKGTELLFGDTIVRGGGEEVVSLLTGLNGKVNLPQGNTVYKTELLKVTDKHTIKYDKYTDKVFRKGKEVEGVKNGDTIERKRPIAKLIPIETSTVELVDGDRLVRDGKWVEVKYPEKKRITLQIGDIVERHLRKGDQIIINRQPTLHRGSMLAKKIVPLPYKTLRMNLATCKSFNADFDGDEMNVHVPQSYDAEVELRLLCETTNHIISAQESKPIITIVQDALTGVFIMTKYNHPISQQNFLNLSMKGERPDGSVLFSHERIQTIQQVLSKFGKNTDAFNGRGLISLILPYDFYYENTNNAHPSEPTVKIFKGVLYEGALDKKTLGSTHNSIIQVLCKYYDTRVTANFIDNVQFLVNNWLILNGFSIGLEDCMITSEQSVASIKDTLAKCYMKAQCIEETTQNPGIREVRVTAALSQAKDIGMRIAKNAMKPTNNFLATVNSGSKGDFFNIAQITGLLGQQNIAGKRVVPLLNHGTRALPHYPFGNLTKEKEYESKGFVCHSFIHGLTPEEFIFHAMSGREGICDTAMGTAKSGYIQRKIVKVCEDIQVKYGGRVMDTSGHTYQFSYGENGLDPLKTIPVNHQPQVCGIDFLTTQLNNEFEQGNVKGGFDDMFVSKFQKMSLGKKEDDYFSDDSYDESDAEDEEDEEKEDEEDEEKEEDEEEDEKEEDEEEDDEEEDDSSETEEDITEQEDEEEDIPDDD